MTDYTLPCCGWICSRCGTILPNTVDKCPRCVDEEQEEYLTNEESQPQ